MVKCGLPSCILKLWNDGKNGVYKSTGRSFRKAYMPFLTKMTTVLLDLASKNPEVEACIKTEPLWEAYQKGEYEATRANELKQLGGGTEKKANTFEPETEPPSESKVEPAQSEEGPKEPSENKYANDGL